MSGLEFLLIAKGIALVKAHFAVAAVHTANTAAAAHVPAAVAHKAAIHIAQTGVQAAASAPTATQAAATLASTAGLAYGIASQGGGTIGSAQRKLGRHGIGNPRPTVETIREVDDLEVDEPVRFPEPARMAAEEKHIENEKPVPPPVPAKASSNGERDRGQREMPAKPSSSNKKQATEQIQNQQRNQRPAAREPNEVRLEDQPYTMETLELNDARFSLDFNGKIGKSLFMFFRLCELVLTPTTLGFIAAAMAANGEYGEYGWYESTIIWSINGGSVFALLVTLWSLGFLAYRMVMTFKPTLDRKVIALTMELLTILLVFCGAMGLTFAFSCYVCAPLPW